MKTKLIFLLCLCHILGFSQKDFLPGFLINNSGDTLKCDISEKSLKFPFNEVEVMFSGASKTQRFSSHESLGFGFDDVTYRTIKTSVHLTKIESSKSKWEVRDNSNIFLKLVTSGEIDLYASKNNDGIPIFFVGDVNNEVTQLIYHSYYKPNGELALNRNFVNQLYLLTKDKKLSLTDLAYDEPSLKKFINRYNNLADGSHSKSKVIKYRLGVGATYFLPHLVTGVVSNVDFSSTVSPNLSLDMIYPLGKSSSFFSFGLNYNFYKATKTSGNIYSHIHSFSSNNLFAYAGLRNYFFKSIKVNPYLTGGFGINESFGGYTFLEDGKKVRMKGGNLLNKDFMVRAHSIKWFAGAGVRLTEKVETEFKFERIERYNERSDNGGTSRLNGFSFAVLYNLN